MSTSCLTLQLSEILNRFLCKCVVSLSHSFISLHFLRSLVIRDLQQFGQVGSLQPANSSMMSVRAKVSQALRSRLSERSALLYSVAPTLSCQCPGEKHLLLTERSRLTLNPKPSEPWDFWGRPGVSGHVVSPSQTARSWTRGGPHLLQASGNPHASHSFFCNL